MTADTTTTTVTDTACALGVTNKAVIAAATAVAVACVVVTSTAIIAYGFSTTKVDAADAVVSACAPGIKKTSGDSEKSTVAAIASITDTVAAVSNATTVATDACGIIKAITAAIVLYLTATTAAAIDDYSLFACKADCAV